MGDVTALFWDVGGVILSNGWDRAARAEAAKKFGLDWEDFQDRHELSSPAFETGQITLDTYLQRTVFYRKRAFTRDEFIAFIFAQSEEFPESRAVLSGLARTGKYLLATINNEPLELNVRRIEQFNLRREFEAFFSSCFVRIRKPDEAIYRLALEVTQRRAEECLFIDDRALNLECARQITAGFAGQRRDRGRKIIRRVKWNSEWSVWGAWARIWWSAWCVAGIAWWVTIVMRRPWRA
jgi:putative hydrolase of the HAD superfamily